MKPVVTFGEVMTRFTPPGFLRLTQAMPGSLDVTFGGAEANVAASIALLGQPVRFATALPDNEIGTACLRQLRGLGIDVSTIVQVPDSRLGTYYLEIGANQRGSTATYDRAHSAIADFPPEKWDWDTILRDAGWFHTTGITLAISETAAQAAINGAQAARERGIPVSCDLNYRKKLWKWGPGPHGRALARTTIAQLLPFADVVIGNEEDADDMLGITAGDSNVDIGRLDVERYQDVAVAIRKRFPNIKQVAFTLRESLSATHNRWGAMLYDTTGDSSGTSYFAPMRDGEYTPHEITSIVDRVGAGDSFGAGLIFALRDPELGRDLQKALTFAVASSALAHSIVGDTNYVTREQVEALASGNTSGRVQR